MSKIDGSVFVVALGGNAISPPNEVVSSADQFRHTRKSLLGLSDLFKAGYKICITHGNGPQVGDALLRVEKAKGFVPEVPLELLVAETEGSMGYMIEQSIQNLLALEHIKRDVVTIVTQVLVNKDDPALLNPTKFVGATYSKEEAEQIIEKEGWIMKPSKGDTHWRRVVGSPRPISILNRNIISDLVHRDTVVIAGGGGGIPVYEHPALGLKGIDAVIDKDLASAILALDIGADVFIILTSIDSVRINYNKPNEKVLDTMTLDECKYYIAEGHFQAGSMKPKVEAALNFVQASGKTALICHLEHLTAALNGSAGTKIIP